MAEIKIKLQPFLVPETVNSITQPSKKQDGPFSITPSWKLSELSYEILDELCDEFRTNVLEKAGVEDRKYK